MIEQHVGDNKMEVDVVTINTNDVRDSSAEDLNFDKCTFNRNLLNDGVSTPDIRTTNDLEQSKGNELGGTKIYFLHEDYKLSDDDDRATKALLLDILKYWSGKPTLLLAPDSWFLFLPSAFLQLREAKIMNMYAIESIRVVRRLWSVFFSGANLPAIIDCFKKNDIPDEQITQFQEQQKIILTSGELEEWEAYLRDNVETSSKPDPTRGLKTKYLASKWRGRPKISDPAGAEDYAEILPPSAGRNELGKDTERIVGDLTVHCECGDGDDSGKGDSLPSSVPPSPDEDKSSPPKPKRFDMEVEPSTWESYYSALVAKMNEKGTSRQKSRAESSNLGRNKSSHEKSTKMATLPEGSSELFHNIKNLYSDKDMKTETILKAFKLTLTVSDANGFRLREWLTDPCIDICLAMIQKRNNASNSGLPKLFVVNVCLCAQLEASNCTETGPDYSNMLEFSAGKDIFRYRYAMFPINVTSSHWFLLVADFENHTLSSYDGKLGDYERHTENAINLIKGYLKQEARKHSYSDPDLEKWQFHYTEETLPNLPRQQNHSDCGAFLLAFANCLALEKPFNFKERDMSYNRLYFAYHALVTGAVGKDDWKCC